MSYRNPRPALRFSSVMTALVLAVGAYGSTVSAAISDPGAGFHYDTGRATAVDIRLAAGDGNPALLSFYSEGANGLRLLENAFTDAQGNYLGEMRLPAHLNQVVVVVRSAQRQDTFTLPISNQWITYAE